MAELPPLTVVGAGGHAKVVISAARAAGFRIAEVLDDDKATHGTRLAGVLVTGPIADLLEGASGGVVLAIGSNRTRKQISERYAVDYHAVVHPSAVIDPSVVVENGAVVFAGAVIQPDTVVRQHAIVNTSASVDHDCVIGEFAHIAPGTRLAGGVRVSRGAFLGIGACAIPGVTIGEWSSVGAGASIIGDIPDNVVAVGVPAKVLRRSV